MARWRLHLILLVLMLLIGALATWRIGLYPVAYRLSAAWQMPLLGLRVLQVATGLGAVVCGVLLLRDHHNEAHDARRYNWLCPGCHHIVEAERQRCPFCGASRAGATEG